MCMTTSWPGGLTSRSVKLWRKKRFCANFIDLFGLYITDTDTCYPHMIIGGEWGAERTKQIAPNNNPGRDENQTRK